MTAYYNENDPKAAAWLRELIKRGLIAPGEVDERSIVDVQHQDLVGYTQAHFFAGIGGWSVALRLAGWPDDRPVWTGSCPCQPFSVAGKRAGTDDKRHLWPEFARLIAVGRPPIVVGEQVAGKDGRKWLAGVRADLERMGYGVGAADLCAAGAGAPHIRQRLCWVAESDGRQSGDGRLQRSGEHGCKSQDGATGRLEHSECSGRSTRRSTSTVIGAQRSAEYASETGRMGDSDKFRTQRTGTGQRIAEAASAWSDFDILACTDGKSRRVESGTFPLAHGIPARMGRLRGYGNAIVPQVAAEFIRAYLG